MNEYHIITYHITSSQNFGPVKTITKGKQTHTQISGSHRFYTSTRRLFENVRDNQLDAEEFNNIFITHFALPCKTHNGYLNLLRAVAHEVPELGQ